MTPPGRSRTDEDKTGVEELDFEPEKKDVCKTTAQQTQSRKNSNKRLAVNLSIFKKKHNTTKFITKTR